MKLFFLIIISSTFLFSQEEKKNTPDNQKDIPVIDFTSLDYPIDQKVKIYYNKDWKSTKFKDSASYFRLITFKKNNFPKGKIEDYHATGELQIEFYSNYVGLDSKGKDSIAQQNGPAYYYKNGNISYQCTFFNNHKVGQQVNYYRSGETRFTVNYENDLRQGEQINYYKSRITQFTANYIDDKKQGKQTSYYESGKVKFTRNYEDDSRQGQQINYYESGEKKYTLNWVNDKKQGQEIGYYESGEKEYTLNYENDLKQGQRIEYYKSGETKKTTNYEYGDAEGEEIGYYESGEKEYTLNYENGLKQGQRIEYYKSGETKITINFEYGDAEGEEIGYYESGEKKYTKPYIEYVVQGEQIGYYKSGEIYYTLNYEYNLEQDEQIYYYKSGQTKDTITGLYIPGEIDYTKLWLDGELQERRIALVIGNADYEKGSLDNPVNDAKLIAKSLKELGFEVEQYENVSSRNEMIDAIKGFGRKRKNYEIGFVYYAGHGIQLNNENYLLPTKEIFEYEDDVETYGVSMQRILRYLVSTRDDQLNFIVLDACRDNPYESNWNKTRSFKGAGLAKIAPPAGSLIAFSTDHGQTAADGDGENSLYSQVLAKKLIEKDVTIEQVFKNVRTEVLKISNNNQSPVEENKLTGDVFYLNKKSNK